MGRIKQLLGSANSLRHKLIMGGIGNSLIQASSRFIALLFGIILARTMGADGYGTYAWAMAMMATLMFLAEAGMPTLLIREVAAGEVRKDWPHMRGLVTRSIQVVLLAATTIAAIIAICVHYLGGDIDPTLRDTVLLTLILLPLIAVGNTILAVLQGLRHVVKSLAVSMVLRPLLALAAVGIMALMHYDGIVPQSAVSVQIGAGACTLALAFYLALKHLPPPFRSATPAYETRKWLTSSLSFIFIGGANLLNNQTDILLLGYFRPVDEVGIYRVATQGAALVVFGLQVVNGVIAPQFARMYAAKDMERLQRLVTVSARVALVVAGIFAGIFVLFGEPILSFIFGAEFAVGHKPLAILATGQLLNAAMGSVGFLLAMSGHEQIVARTLLATALLNIVLNSILIPVFGASGAAFATAVSIVAWNITLAIVVKKRININSTAFAMTG